MIADFRGLENGSILQTDVCIAGGGAAGISIAKELAGTNMSVIVLESGGDQYDTNVQALYSGESSGLDYFPLDVTRQRVFGGTTNHWGGWCSPLDNMDFRHRTWVQYSGWPVEKADIDPYYERAQKLCGIGPYRYDPSYWQDVQYKFFEDLMPEKFENKLWQFTSKQYSFGKVFARELNLANNVTVFLHANVTNIETWGDGNSIEKFKVQSLDQTTSASVQAKIFVLACGGLENVRLLLASRDTHKNGLANENDLVGRFFMEHPHIHVGDLITVKESSTLANYGGPTVRRGTHLRPAFYLSEKAKEKHKTTGFALLATPETSFKKSPAYQAFRRTVRRIGRRATHGDKKISDPVGEDLIRILADLDEVAEGVYYRMKGKQPPVPSESNVALLSMSEQAPNPDSRVMLSSERDSLGMPRLNLTWKLTEIDLHTVRTGSQLVAEEFGRLGLGRVKLSGWESDDRLAVVGGHHHMGTTRMNINPKLGVVDQNCRVHGIDNFYIAGCSVFPTSGVSNPTLTLVALAIRLADHLRFDLLS